MCPYNHFRKRDPAFCSGGHIYEEKCIQGRHSNNFRSLISRQLIEYVKTFSQ